jgi:mitotic-spindle organizing protein 1
LAACCVTAEALLGVVMARAVAFEISRLLDTGLDRETLSICVSLLESGVHPDALAAVVKELRREAAELKARPRGPAPRVTLHLTRTFAVRLRRLRLRWAALR